MARALFALLSASLVSGAAFAAGPSSEPLPYTETGMHTGPVRRIATDAAGRWAVTVSEDKTARVWNVSSAQLVMILRPPRDAGNEGELHSVAVAPDGKTVAVAGWTGWAWDKSHSVYLFERSTGRMTRRWPGLPTPVAALGYSPDGRWLAVGLQASGGIRLFDAASGEERARDADYTDTAISLDFSGDSQRLIGTGFDGRLRVYAVGAPDGLLLLNSTRLTAGSEPLSARFSPNGQRIAVGYRDSPSVQVLDAQTLAELLRPASTGALNGNLGRVAWSLDGRGLLAGGSMSVNGRRFVRRWAVDDWSRHEDVSVSDLHVMDLVPLPAPAGHGWLFASADPAWGVLAASGKLLRRQDGANADFRGQLDQLKLSADGQRVHFGYLVMGQEPRVFDVGMRTLNSGFTARFAGTPLLAARTRAPGLELARWRDQIGPTLNGRPLPAVAHEVSRCAAIAPGDRQFVLGGDWSLRAFDAGGQRVWGKPSPGPLLAVNISADGRFVVTAGTDGTIRWHRMSNGRELLAFFPHADRKRWVAWTPEGYFDASPGAEDLIAFHLNRSPDREGEAVGARQLWETFYQPALIARRLGPDGDALMAEQVNRRGDVRQLLRADSAPELTLESAQDAQTDGTYELKVRVRRAGQGTGRLVLRVDDGAELAGRWNAPALTQGSLVSMPVELAAGLHRLTVELVDERGVASGAVEARVNVRRPADGTPATLHVLAVGVSNYRDQSLARGVAFAADDAQAVGAAFERGARGLFGAVRATVLPDAQATRSGIEASASALAAAVKAEDTVVIYLAGHGVSAGGDYHFVPWDTRYTNLEALVSQSLSADRLRQMLAAITARKVLVLLDTCSAGRFSLVQGREIDDKASIDRLQRTSGRAVIAATADEKMALEGEGRHGVFTYALLRALEGAADTDNDGMVNVGEIGEYIDEQVPAITRRKWGYEQVPMMETRGSRFPVARRTR